jgi:hypothetical protein
VGRQAAAGVVIAAVLTAWAPLAQAASLVIDRGDGRVLTSYAPSRTVDARHAHDLLLAVAVGRLLRTNALAGDATPTLPRTSVVGPPLTVDELYQLFLLTRDGDARRGLVAAVEATAHGLAYLERLAAAFHIGDVAPLTRAAADAREPARPTGAVALREVARLAFVLVSDADTRRRLALDGAPIADGAIIVRASSPLVAVAPPHAADEASTDEDTVAALLGERGGLTLLAVAAGPTASAEAFDRLQHGLATYRRLVVVRAGERAVPPVAVRGGAAGHVAAIAAADLALTRNRTSSPPLVVSIQLPDSVEAPVAARQHLGDLVVEERGRIIAVVPLLAARAIAPAGWLDTASY